jgi:diguanylate cyclase (GGDEF)-like protein
MQISFSQRVQRLGLILCAAFFVLGGIYSVQHHLAVSAATAERESRAAQSEFSQFMTALAAMDNARQQFLLSRNVNDAKRYGEQRASVATLGQGLLAAPNLGPPEDLIARISSLSERGEVLLEQRLLLGLSQNDGLEGALRQTAHELERELNALGDDALMVSLLMMRRHEKNFILRGRADYVERFEARALDLQRDIKARMGEGQATARLMAVTDEYVRAFSSHAQQTMEHRSAVKAVNAEVGSINGDLALVKNNLAERVVSASQRRLHLEASNRRLLLTGGVAFVIVIAGAGALFRNDHEFAALLGQQHKLIAQGKALEQLSAANTAIAMEDALTGLPNRRAFFAELERLVLFGQSHELAFGVGVIDLDGFKLINELHGHRVGDELLQSAAGRLIHSIGGDFFIARLGGDEFGVIFTELSDPELLKTIGREICGTLSLPFDLSTGRARIAATLGVATYPEAAATAQGLFERADYALGHAKAKLRGETVIFSDTHRNAIQRVARMEDALHNANFDEELCVFFQPIMDIQSGDIVAMEALARWNHADLGSVAPDIFIRAAEKSGTINHITQVLLQKALEAADAWPRPIGLSFNLSAIDLAPHAVLQIVALIESSEFDPKRLTLEITETAVMQDLNQAIASLGLLRRLGCRIALDDFGTGYSSLSYLHTMPIDRVKIDRSFICDLEHAKPALDIVRAVQALCNTLKLDCVVEGVETKTQHDALEEIGCTLVQGYHYSRPIDAVSAAAFIEHNTFQRAA